MSGRSVLLWVLVLFSLPLGGTQVGVPAPGVRNEMLISRVIQGKVREAKAGWWGFNPVDSTKTLQDAINSGASKVIVENFDVPWNIGPIKLASNQQIVFEKDVIVQAKRGAFQGPNDCLFTAWERENVTLTGPGATLRMWRQDYASGPYKRGEWRHILNIISCKNVNIAGLTLSSSGGDGIYLGGSERGGPNQNIHIYFINCNDNYRQGVSVISAMNLLIENCVFLNTNGTDPMGGIDFEPNTPSQVLVNCIVRNCRSQNNGGPGFLFTLGNLGRASTPVSIWLENCQTIGNKRDLSFWIKPEDSVKADLKLVNCKLEKIPIETSIPKVIDIRFENCEITGGKSNTLGSKPIIFNGYPRR
ncbi:right-handed parallel beta-helix repeat-containing protein [Geothrix oryzisoli]|uniref:right-handed parallel beta-helix repeat-containing protein n=1 Tax=Geothrix oryzisoli TaxID=2922721 RepID=UPI001FAE5567|nr:right-handed parallel beta-helix repeat-containing protein [Geothrix oryzisoli]